VRSLEFDDPGSSIDPVQRFPQKVQGDRYPEKKEPVTGAATGGAFRDTRRGGCFAIPLDLTLPLVR
jgi:hypothetical protein